MKEAFDTTRHIPVLLDEVVRGLVLTPGNIVIDATLGGGGHAKAILQEVLPNGKVIAIDTDEDAIQRFKQTVETDAPLKRALHDKSLVLVHGNYSAIGKVLVEQNIENVDAILADLGFSSDQIESSERGFSFQTDGPLDMRLDQSKILTAEKIVNTYGEEELARLLYEYGDEKESRRIAKAIVFTRGKQPITTTGALKNLIEEVYPKGLRYKMKINPATKTFQALRIAVNQEFEHLEDFLKQAIAVLKPKGRLAVITFHSGEDRIVKQFFKEMSQGCICPPEFPICQCKKIALIKILTKKPIRASSEEEKSNPRARSAKLRIVEKE